MESQYARMDTRVSGTATAIVNEPAEIVEIRVDKRPEKADERNNEQRCRTPTACCRTRYEELKQYLMHVCEHPKRVYCNINKKAK